MPSIEEEQQRSHSSLQVGGNMRTATIAQSQNAPGSVDNALGMLDELVATPMANANAILGDLGSKFYDIVNTCKNTALWHGLIGAGVGVSAFIGFCVSFYRRLRDKEKTSHFFWFKRLLYSSGKAEILKLLNKLKGENDFDTESLITAAHFYSPDISRFVSWKRRVFCRGEKRKKLKLLQEEFEKEKSKKIVLARLFNEISKITISILNQNAGSDIFECKNRDSTDKSEKADYSIELTESYKKKFFTTELLNEIELEKRPSLTAALLRAVGDASFIYWIVVFIFCLAPVGIVGGISVPPLIIAFGFLIARLGIITYQFGKGTFDENNNSVDDSAQKEAILEGKLIELYKREAFIKSNGIKKVSFIGSELQKDLGEMLRKRDDHFSKFHVKLNGFVEGCFLPFFAIWLFSDLFTVLTWVAIGASPAAPVLIGIAIITLLLGVGYGIYSARKAADAQEARYKELERKIAYLEQQNVQIADLSLQAYDRLLRRYSLEEPLWTRVKKALNRTWVIIKRLGTGSLVFRLVIWGTITACVGALIPSALVAPIAIPFIVGFAVFFAASYYCAYNAESKLKQAEEVVDHLYYKRRLITEQENLSVTSKNSMQVDLSHKYLDQLTIGQEQTLENGYFDEAKTTKRMSLADQVQTMKSPSGYVVATQKGIGEIPVCPTRASAAGVQDNFNNDDRALLTTKGKNRVVEQSNIAVGKRIEGNWAYPAGPGLWKTHPHADYIGFLNQETHTSPRKSAGMR
jgi:hypothetical protein